MKYLILVTIIIFSSNNTFAQGFKWAKSIGCTFSDELTGMAMDADKNVYTVGTFASTADFDPSSNNFLLTPAAGKLDLFICKLDSSGNFVWAKQITTNYTNTNFVNNAKINIDKFNNVIITSSFSGTTDFDPNAGVQNQTSTNRNMFILKLTNTGNFVWVKQINSSGLSIVMDLCIDNDNNLYTMGLFLNATDFDPDTSTYTVNSAGIDYNFFVLKLDSLGDFVWVKTIEANASLNENGGIIIDDANNVVVAGSFTDTMDADPGVGVFNLYGDVGGFNSNFFVLKLDPSGSFKWAKGFDGNGPSLNMNFVRDVKVDSKGNTYLVGSFRDTLDMNPDAGVYPVISGGGNISIYICKLDSLGNFVWAHSFLAAANDGGNGLAIDKDDNIYTTGNYKGNVDFDPSSNVYNLTGGASKEVFISVLDSAGKFKWARSVVGSYDQGGKAIMVDENSNVITAGYFTSSVDFNPGTGTSFILSNGGNALSGKDIFIQKFRYDTSNTVINQIACNQFTYNNQVFTASTVFKDTFLSEMGIDSLLTLNLTINNTKFGNDSTTACNSYFYNNKTVTSSGNYMDTLIATNGCDSIHKKYITIINPNVTLTQNATTFFCQLSGVSYQWVQCPNYNEIAGATTQSFTPGSNNNFAVVIIQNGCKDTSNCVSLSTSSINTAQNGATILVGPNPTSNILIIENKINLLVNASCRLKSITGTLMIEKHAINENKFTLDITNLSNGIYIVELINATQINRIKIIKN